MQKFSVQDTDLSGLKKISAFRAEDVRGYFIKDYSEELLLQNEITHELKEVFYTSSYKGVIRAIHFQRNYQQAKLVRVVKGSVFDVAVDLRKESPTFGQWRGFYLTEDNATALLLPGGFGHGYLVLEDSIVSYKCAEKFYEEYDDGVLWTDEELAIQWPLEQVNSEIILAEKDQKLQSFSEFKRNYGGLK